MPRGKKKKTNAFELPDLSSALDEATDGLSRLSACTDPEVLRAFAPALTEAIAKNDEHWQATERAAVDAVIARFRPLQDTLEACRKVIAERLEGAS